VLLNPAPYCVADALALRRVQELYRKIISRFAEDSKYITTRCN